MKLPAPEESFDTDFRKLLNIKKPPSYIQSILANALETKSIESLPKMADNITENAGPPRFEEVSHTAHLVFCFTIYC
ncbi:unnamed protein product [Hymenolepis diminuta]|uniref:Uncharacterized protein n=1 Tax=Hymenolepis diminuta TaxID=6216 RepID=A0A564Y7K2_HYMDI|nr:unnamed protein product [Hymenolepis diminuta]VUZ45398.1 unnamed protein product [Hymenolepis diminuta]